MEEEAAAPSDPPDLQKGAEKYPATVSRATKEHVAPSSPSSNPQLLGPADHVTSKTPNSSSSSSSSRSRFYFESDALALKNNPE